MESKNQTSSLVRNRATGGQAGKTDLSHRAIRAIFLTLEQPEDFSYEKMNIEKDHFKHLYQHSGEMAENIIVWGITLFCNFGGSVSFLENNHN